MRVVSLVCSREVYPKLNSPFWRGFRALSAAINNCEDSALWTNVFKVNVLGSVMQKLQIVEVSPEAGSERFATKKIRILKPDVVIFFQVPGMIR